MKNRMMFIFLGCITFIFCNFGVVLPSHADCDDAASYARMAYNADTLEEAQEYARRAMSAAEDAESEASSAQSAASDAQSTASDAQSACY